MLIPQQPSPLPLKPLNRSHDRTWFRHVYRRCEKKIDFSHFGYRTVSTQRELLATVKAWLQDARPEKADKGPPIPDGLLLTAVLQSGGQQYRLDMPADLFQPLQTAYEATVRHALLGRWRQTGWKLCTPAAQLTADDYDLPIEELSFRPDGAFTRHLARRRRAYRRYPPRVHS